MGELPPPVVLAIAWSDTSDAQAVCKIIIITSFYYYIIFFLLLRMWEK